MLIIYQLGKPIVCPYCRRIRDLALPIYKDSIFIPYTMFIRWRDVLRESTLEGHHTKVVKLGPRYGFIPSIVSEVMFLYRICRGRSDFDLISGHYLPNPNWQDKKHSRLYIMANFGHFSLMLTYRGINDPLLYYCLPRIWSIFLHVYNRLLDWLSERLPGSKQARRSLGTY